MTIQLESGMHIKVNNTWMHDVMCNSKVYRYVKYTGEKDYNMICIKCNGHRLLVETLIKELIDNKTFTICNVIRLPVSAGVSND